jgi:hypothetical protein
MNASLTDPRIRPSGHGSLGSGELGMEARVCKILNRWPAVGLAVGVVRDGSLELFHGHGVADIASNTPITEDTVFQVGSITETFTAIAVMQLWERGLVDLDAAANDYLRAYRLVPAKAGFRPATMRHLLTHTAGIPEVVRVSDLLHPGWGPQIDHRPAVASWRAWPAAGSPAPAGRAQHVEVCRVTQQPNAGEDRHPHRLSGLAAAGEAGSGRGGKGKREQARRRGGDGAQVAGDDGLHQHAKCPEPKQQPDHGVNAEHRRPVGDRAAQAVAMVGPGDRHVQS